MRKIGPAPCMSMLLLPTLTCAGVCCSCIPCPSSGSTSSTCLWTNASPSTCSMDGIQLHSHMDQYQLQVEGPKEGFLMVVGAQMGTLCRLSCSSRLSWHLPNLSPTASATHHSQHCNRMGSWMLR